METQVGNPNSAWLLIIVAIGVALAILAGFLRRNALRQFATSNLLQSAVTNKSRSSRWISTVLVTSSLILLTLALLDYRWGKAWKEVPQKGIEVMFVLDVSRSMLAEDASPNRLDRAKQQIKDMVNEMAGDRIGLIVFAGETRQSVPLTSHYEDFKQTLDSVGPHSVRRGGSRLGDAIAAAADGFISKTNDHKAMVIFTDGEDQESQPLEIAKQKHEETGVRVFTIGLGDIDRGSRIPDINARRKQFVQHEGKQVWSKLNGKILQQIASETGGVYVPAGTKQVNMSDVYHGYVANVEQTEFETAKIKAYIPRYHRFAFPAFLLLLAEVFLCNGRPSLLRRSRKQTPKVGTNNQRPSIISRRSRSVTTEPHHAA